MPTRTKSTSAPLSEDAIRHRAYLMWEADGRPDGRAEHYWMKASEASPAAGIEPEAKAKTAKAKDKSASPAETGPAKSRPAKAADKLKAAAAKVTALASKAKPAAKAGKRA